MMSDTLKQKKKRSRLFLTACLLLAVIVGGLITTFDVNHYKGELSHQLSQKLGRGVSFKGDLALAVSYDDGVMLQAKNVFIENPAWATRKDMARIGDFRFRLDLPSLFHGKMLVKALTIDHSQLQLESNASGQNNWTFVSASSADKTTKQEDTRKDKEIAPNNISLQIKEARLTNSELGFRGPDGKLTLVTVSQLALQQEHEKMRLILTGRIQDIEADLTIEGGAFDQLGKVSWPFTIKGRLGAHEIVADGVVGAQNKKVTLESFTVRKGERALTGALQISFESAKPDVVGLFRSKELDESFFSLAGISVPSVGEGGTSQESSTTPVKRIFSHKDLDFSALRKANVKLDIKIDRWRLGPAYVDDIDLDFGLRHGTLNLPFLARLGGKEVSGALVLNASSEVPSLDITFKGDGIDLNKLISYESVNQVLSGQAAVSIKIESKGRSSYDLAAHANGKLDLLFDSGSTSSGLFSGFMGQVADYVFPEFSAVVKTGFNCVAAHYVIKNGLLQTKGFLLDTQMTTLGGDGFINLPDERINMYFKARSKGVGAVIPSVKIYGRLREPDYTIESASVVSKVMGLVNGQQEDTSIPSVVAVKGQNACEVALTKPVMVGTTSSSKTQSSIVPGMPKDVEDKIKDIGGQLFDQLGGGLFGQ